MKYTEKEFMAGDPCQGGVEFAKARGFDFVKCYQEIDNPNWLLWTLNKVGAITKESALKLSLTFENEVMPVYREAHPEDDKSPVLVSEADKYSKEPVTTASRVPIAALIKHDNGLFAAASIVMDDKGEGLGSKVAQSANLALSYLLKTDDPKLRHDAMVRQCDIIRSIIRCPFE